jgi:hypothetical protein
MSRKSFSPALPSAVNDPSALSMGFTAWVDLRSDGIATVLAYRRGLDRHLSSIGLVRSMNPLHMLVWSPERTLTVPDQIDLLAWLATDGSVARVCLGGLRPHCGIPCERGRKPVHDLALTDPHWLAVLNAYRMRLCGAEQVLDLIVCGDASRRS